MRVWGQWKMRSELCLGLREKKQVLVLHRGMILFIYAGNHSERKADGARASDGRR